VTVLLVAAGGLIGVLARYGLGTTISADDQPWMIFAISMAGSFMLGAVLTCGGQLSEPVRTGLAVGFCGGFTTFSTVTVQVVLDARNGDASFALVYLAASIGGGLIAAGLGYCAAAPLLSSVVRRKFVCSATV
jgi:CrcB protein